jgi:hypothetical protein
MLKPVKQARFPHHDRGRLGTWIVLTDDLQEAPVAGAFPVGNDDPITRLALGAYSAQSDSHHGSVRSPVFL